MTVRALIYSILACSLLALAPARARADARAFVVYAPGMGGSQQQAKPYLDSFLRSLEKQLGWPAGSATGEYVDDPKEFAAHLANKKPGYGLISPAAYLELACKKVPLTPLASALGTGNVGVVGHWHVVVKAGTASRLEDLKGKRLSSNHLEDTTFVSRIVFDGQIDAAKFFQLQPTSSTVKPFKAIDRGEADAALVDDDQLAHMRSLPFAQSLKVIYDSPTLPPYPVVSFDKVVTPAERAAVRKAILAMCSTPQGGEVCKSILIKRFETVDPALFAAAEARYCKP
jgi:ABC-type phosphate/phosphonate transport system substrate-binding protein